MKLSGIALLLLFAASSQAAPRVPSDNQVYESDSQDHEEPPVVVDFWPLGAFDSDEHVDDSSYFEDESPFQGNVELNFDVNEDNMNLLLNDTIANILFKDLENRIAEDVRRMEEDTLLFQKLFGSRRPYYRTPSWFMPWGIPDDPSDNSPSFFSDEDSDEDYGLKNPLIPSFDNDGDDDDDDVDDDSFFAGFPFLGIDRPLFPDLPNIPGVGFANPEDLPDNYSNETHETHSINGSQVVVNNTINKESGDDFSSFFHHQVIHFRPDEPKDVVPAESETPVDKVIEEDDGNDDGNIDEINTALPNAENEIDSKGFNPEAIPEVIPEITSDIESELHGPRPEQAVNEEELEVNNLLDQQAAKRIAARSLHEFNPIVFPADDPKSAALVSNSLTEEVAEIAKELALDSQSSAYISNSLDNEDDFEEIDNAKAAPPDLSSDTRVNRIHVNKQGMTRVDPDAEIFNYGLVLEEARSRPGDK